MSRKELRAFGVNTETTEDIEQISNTKNNDPNSDSNSVDSNNIMATVTTATQVNPFHEAIDLSSAEGKELHQKATQGLPDDEKHKGDSKDVINFIELVKSKSEDFRWDSITTNIWPKQH